jgi:hypothetical protein
MEDIHTQTHKHTHTQTHTNTHTHTHTHTGTYGVRFDVIQCQVCVALFEKTMFFIFIFILGPDGLRLEAKPCQVGIARLRDAFWVEWQAEMFNCHHIVTLHSKCLRFCLNLLPKPFT